VNDRESVAAAGAEPAKRVFDLFPALPHAAADLFGSALGLQLSVTGGLTGIA
jgi:hypothetical protein